MELTNHFNKFLSNIEPPLTCVEDVSVGHTVLRGRLNTDDSIKNLIVETFLSGSYARNTAVTPIKDVDVIIVLNADKQKIMPKDLLIFLHKTLIKYYPNKTFRQHRSIKVSLKYVDMDIVPAISVSKNDSKLYIPEYRPPFQKWILSDPKGHSEFVTSLNSKTEEMFVPLIKSIKWWRNFKMVKENYPKSILIETLLGQAVNKYKFNSIAGGILSFFRYMLENYSIYYLTNNMPIINDPALKENNLATEWENIKFRNFISIINIYYKIAYKAFYSPNESESKGSWQILLGPKFPFTL